MTRASQRPALQSFISVCTLSGTPEVILDTLGPRALQQASRAALLDVELIRDQDSFIPHATVTRYLDELARIAGDEDFVLALVPYLSVAAYGCWGRYVLAAPTLGQALVRAEGAMHLHSRGDRVAVDRRGQPARIAYASAARGTAGYRHLAIGIIGVILGLCRHYLLSDWRPLRVELDLPRPRGDRFERAFGCPVLFDAPVTAVCLDAGDLGLARPRLVMPEVTIEDVTRARAPHLGGSTVVDAVARQIRTQILVGEVGIDHAARALDFSTRTLQRELGREGTDFRSIANRVRSQRAAELLHGTDLSITSISLHLGYSGPANFARAFRSATGLAPGEYRQTRHGQTAALAQNE